MGDRIAENLFRRQAIKSLAAPVHGRPLANMPRAWSWVTLFIVVFAGTAMLFAVFARYSHKQVVRGWLVAEQGDVRVTHASPALVQRVIKASGDMVRRGDALLYLTRDAHLENGQGAARQVLDELNNELREVTFREGLAEEQADAAKASIRLEIEAVDAELRELGQQQVGQRRRVALAEERLSRLRAAAGAVAEWRVLEQQDEVAVRQLALGQLQQGSARLQRERRNLLARSNELVFELLQARSQFKSERMRLSQAIAQYDAQRITVVTAPIDGRLAAVEVQKGDSIRPQQLLATVLPLDYTLAADVYVPSSAVGQLRPGQRVRLMLDAFPHQQFGAALGDVESVSEFVLLPTDIPPTFGIREATYKVRITLRDDGIGGAGERYPLRPGMLLAAEIIVEDLRLVDWLLQPLRQMAS